jgi:hypothetical protein
MAEGKKSILIYSDWKHTFEALTDAEAGQLIKHLLAYVNDENPKTDNRIVQIAFEPMKQHLKRDLVKYEQIKDKRSEAGKISAEKKKQNQQVLTSVESVQQTSTNSTVNDNVNDNVIIDKSIIEEKDKKLREDSKKNWNELINSKMWFDSIIKNNLTTKEYLVERLKEFWVIANYLENPDRKEAKDIKTHFANWLKTNPPKKIAAPLSDNPAPWANFGKDIEI